MTVHIDPVGGVLLVVALAVGYFVYKHTQQAPAGEGDVVGAIGCAAAVLTALVLILGGGHPAAPTPGPVGSGVPSVPASPAPGP